MKTITVEDIYIKLEPIFDEIESGYERRLKVYKLLNNLLPKWEGNERQQNNKITKQQSIHIADVRLSLSNIQKAARIAVIKTKKSKGMQTNKITERELELAERAFVNGAIWAKNIIENNTK